MKAADYFCGAGGASIGLHRAGFDVVGYDHWSVAVATHNANGLPAGVRDLSDPTLDDRLLPVDLAWFSPPCQPFSAAGKGLGHLDERDGFQWAIRILGHTLPPVAIFENVRGITYAKHTEYLAVVHQSIRELGYELEGTVLNCADYGVPQTRQRYFMIARRDGGLIRWPAPSHTQEQWVSMAEALGWSEEGLVGFPRRDDGLESVTVGGVSYRARDLFPTDGPAPAMTEKIRSWRAFLDYRQTDGRKGDPIYKDITETPSPTVGTQSPGQWVIRAGQDAKATMRTIDQPAPTVIARKDPNAWTLERPATTIGGDLRVFQPGGHHKPGEQPWNAITLEISQLAVLQDFPADYIWTGTKTAQARQVGNAVPPRMAELLARANMPKGGA